MSEAFYTAPDGASVYLGDCIDIAPTLDPVDAVICDPPYGLGFMGEKWDHSVPGPAHWQAIAAAMKPGAHLVAFGGTRTWHRLTCAIEDAGFEIRDSIMWLYGSGFPKSLNVGKAIDKRRDDTAEVRVVCRWLRAAMERAGHTSRTVGEAFGYHSRMVDHWAARDTDSQPTLPKLEQWDQLRELLGFGEEMDAEVLRLNLRKGEPGEAWKSRPVTGQVSEWAESSNYRMTTRDGIARDEAVSVDALKWAGWGTALKPAWEPIILARKPIHRRVGVAGNVLEHGTGALNLDASRVGDAGRHPANVILDSDAAEQLDAHAGAKPSRFFYCPKVSKAERGKGNLHPTVKPIALMRYLARMVTPPGGVVLDPFTGSGSTLLAARAEGFGAVGIEQNPDYLGIITSRLENQAAQMGAA